MASDLRQSEAPSSDRRADVARLQLRLRQAKRRLVDAEDGSVADAEAARAALVAQLGPMLDQRRLSMDAELETARAAADRRRAEAGRDAVQILERAEQVVRERALRDEAEQTVRDQVAREQAEREQAARDQAEREAAARREAERAFLAQAAREAAEQAAREQAAQEEAALREQEERRAAEQALADDAARREASRALHEHAERARQRVAASAAPSAIPDVPPILDPRFLPTVQVVDGPVDQQLVPFMRPGTQLVQQPSNALPAAGMNDPEVFARAVATVLAAALGERGASAPPQVVVQAPVAQKSGFWANARHLDVLLLGLTTVIVLVVLAAWLA